MRHLHDVFQALPVLALLVFAPTALARSAASPPTPKVVAYVPNWIDLAAFAGSIDYSKLTHINVAFENPTTDAGDISFNAQDAALIAQAHASHVQVLVSIGGGAASTDPVLQRRYAALLGAPQRAGFVAALARYVEQHGFDGLDVDIEGPAISGDYGAFIADLGRALRPQRKLLTAALSQGYGGAQVPSSVFGPLDFVNIMAYDGTGTWAPNAPGQHSSLEFAQRNVAYWLGRGLPRSKAVLGVPFYGYGFGAAFRQWAYPYSEIVASYPEAAQADQEGQTIWYNGVPTIRAKAQWAREQNLAGIMIWSLDGDVRGEGSLLSAIEGVLRPVSRTRASRP